MVHGAEKLMHHESQIFKFHFEALHCHAKYVRHGSRRIFLKSCFPVNEMI